MLKLDDELVWDHANERSLPRIRVSLVKVRPSWLRAGRLVLRALAPGL